MRAMHAIYKKPFIQGKQAYFFYICPLLSRNSLKYSYNSLKSGNIALNQAKIACLAPIFLLL